VRKRRQLVEEAAELLCRSESPHEMKTGTAIFALPTLPYFAPGRRHAMLTSASCSSSSTERRTGISSSGPDR
jgi:hypothetical protein